ncbi:hypothetical protein BDW59DRAFT_161519 [Aspergillus cavernicola]|uniref:Transcription factor domain-containing protein n=1 Tax=Aspergillus cavernicola TaxID=176166 RepID=A0ABR4ICV2_9EURO
MDIWRLLGHASRMFLDNTEAHGAEKTDSAGAGVLYRTLYTLETQMAISFGRPHQLPDGQELPAFSPPEPNSVAAGELSPLRYNLARLQNRFHRDIISNGPVLSATNLDDSHVNAPWMSACISEAKTWLDEWNIQVDAFVDAYSAPAIGGSDFLKDILRHHGRLSQCETLLLAKTATERRGQLFISTEDELEICKLLLQSVINLHQASTSTLTNHPSHSEIPSPSYPLHFTFPWTWTCTHAVFTATIVLLQHAQPNSSPDAETGVQDQARTSLDMLASLGLNTDLDTAELVGCIQNLYETTSK